MLQVMFISIVVFGIAALGMAVGVIFKKKELSGLCGGVGAVMGEDHVDSCGCQRSSADLCAEGDDSGLVAMAELGYPARETKEHHHH